MLPGLLAVNVIAVAVLYGRFAETEMGKRVNDKVLVAIRTVFFPSMIPKAHDHVCGLVPWDVYVLVSTRVILPGGRVEPAAGEYPVGSLMVHAGAGMHEHCAGIYTGIGRQQHGAHVPYPPYVTPVTPCVHVTRSPCERRQDRPH